MESPVKLATYFIMRYTSKSTLYGMSGLAGAMVAVRSLPDLWTAFISFTATWLGGWATLLLNDYFDRKVDVYIRPWRPIPAGRMSANQVLVIAFIVIATGFMLTLSLYNIICLLIAVIVALSVLVYNISKGKRYMTHMVLTLSTALSFVYGYAAAAHGINLESFPMVFIMGLLLYTDAISTALFASIPDIVGDKRGGAVTASVKLGSVKVAKITLTLSTINLIPGLLLFTIGYLNIGYLLAFIATRIMLIGVQTFFIRNPGERLANFVVSTYTFNRMGVFLAFPIGVLPNDIGIMLASLLCLFILSAPIRHYESVFNIEY